MSLRKVGSDPYKRSKAEQDKTMHLGEGITCMQSRKAAGAESTPVYKEDMVVIAVSSSVATQANLLWAAGLFDSLQPSLTFKSLAISTCGHGASWASPKKTMIIVKLTELGSPKQVTPCPLHLVTTPISPKTQTGMDINILKAKRHYKMVNFVK